MHPDIIRLADGWFCPDCKQKFDEKPIVKEKITFLNVQEKDDQPAEEPAEKPKPKKKTTNSKSTAKK